MTMISGAPGRTITGTPAPGFTGVVAWRMRQVHGAQSVLSLPVADAPVTKPYVSASERCP